VPAWFTTRIRPRKSDLGFQKGLLPRNSFQPRVFVTLTSSASLVYEVARRWATRLPTPPFFAGTAGAASLLGERVRQLKSFAASNGFLEKKQTVAFAILSNISCQNNP